MIRTPMPLVIITMAIFSAPLMAQKVVRVSAPEAINPAEVTIAINPKNPDNIVAASFQNQLPPKPRAGSFNYASLDGGRHWKTVPKANPKGLVQGDDAV